MSVPPSEYVQVRGRIVRGIVIPTVLAGMVIALIIALTLGLSWAQVGLALAAWFGPLAFVCIGGVVLAALISTRRALALPPGDANGERLRAILELPRRVELYMLLPGWLAGGASFTTTTLLVFGGPAWAVVTGTLSGFFAALFTGPAVASLVEDALKPAAIAEFLKVPGTLRRQKHGGILWIRQRWYLPYAFTLALVSLLYLDGSIVVMQLRTAIREIMAVLATGRVAATEAVAPLIGELPIKVVVPVAIATALLVCIFAVEGYFLARRQALAANAVEASLRSVAALMPAAPQWVATDETGDLAQAATLVVDEMTGALQRLDQMTGRAKGTSVKLHEIVVQLKAAAAQLSTATTQQVTAVTETAHTMTEMAQTSAASAERATELIAQGEAAAEVVQTGATAARDSTAAMVGITDTLRRITEATQALAERAKRIDAISESVGVLAEQSSTLAINASIEAAKAGEAGKGFGVVAREIRTLAADSRKAALQIREIIGEIRERTRDVDGAVGEGARAVTGGKSLVDRLAQAITHLGDTLHNSVGLMRQVDGAARQHEEGVTQVSGALASLQAASEQIRDSARALGTLAAQAHELAGQTQLDAASAPAGANAA